MIIRPIKPNRYANDDFVSGICTLSVSILVTGHTLNFRLSKDKLNKFKV